MPGITICTLFLLIIGHEFDKERLLNNGQVTISSLHLRASAFILV
jgi:hypothetical protein